MHTTVPQPYTREGEGPEAGPEPDTAPGERARPHEGESPESGGQEPGGGGGLLAFPCPSPSETRPRSPEVRDELAYLTAEFSPDWVIDVEEHGRARAWNAYRYDPWQRLESVHADSSAKLRRLLKAEANWPREIAPRPAGAGSGQGPGSARDGEDEEEDGSVPVPEPLPDPASDPEGPWAPHAPGPRGHAPFPQAEREEER